VLAIILVAAVIVLVRISRYLSSDQPSRTSPSSAVQYSSGVSDLQLQKFAVTLREVADIQARMKDRMLQTTDPVATQEMEQQSSAQMVEAIRRNGLSVEEYALISRATQEAPELFERLVKIQKDLDPTQRRVE
jgi:hypothetical protein